MRVIPALAFRRFLCLFLFSYACFPELSAQQLTTGAANSSNQILTDVVGQPAYLKVTYNMEGSPFYPTEYTRSDIYTKGGKKYPSIGAKFNLESGVLLIKLDDGNELEVTTPVPKIVFSDAGLSGTMLNTVFQNGFPAVGNQTNLTYYQVLDSGKIALLKYFSVTYMDKKEYGQASITRVYEQKETWYVYLPDKSMQKVEKGKDAFLAVFPDKKDLVRQYIDQNGYKCKKEDDWIAVIKYYNGLPAN